MPNLIDALLRECTRVHELVQHYREFGAVGAFESTRLVTAIAEAEAAMASGDVVWMARAYLQLQECKG